jgi:hypothetical protein
MPNATVNIKASSALRFLNFERIYFRTVAMWMASMLDMPGFGPSLGELDARLELDWLVRNGYEKGK